MLQDVHLAKRPASLGGGKGRSSFLFNTGKADPFGRSNDHFLGSDQPSMHQREVDERPWSMKRIMRSIMNYGAAMLESMFGPLSASQIVKILAILAIIALRMAIHYVAKEGVGAVTKAVGAAGKAASKAAAGISAGFGNAAAGAKALAGKAAKGLKKGAKAAAKAAKEGAKAAAKAAAKGMKAAARGAKKAAKAAAEAVDKGLKAADRAGKRMVKAADAARKSAQKAADRFGKGLAKAVGKGLRAADAARKRAQLAADKFGKNLAKTVGKGLKAADAFGKKLVNAAGKGIKALDRAGELMTNAVLKGLGGLAHGLAKGAMMLGGAVFHGLVKLNEGLHAGYRGMKALGKGMHKGLAAGWKGMKAIGRGTLKAVKFAGAAMGNAYTMLDNAVKSMGRGILAVMNSDPAAMLGRVAGKAAKYAAMAGLAAVVLGGAALMAAAYLGRKKEVAKHPRLKKNKGGPHHGDEPDFRAMAKQRAAAREQANRAELAAEDAKANAFAAEHPGQGRRGGHVGDHAQDMATMNNGKHGAAAAAAVAVGAGAAALSQGQDLPPSEDAGAVVVAPDVKPLAYELARERPDPRLVQDSMDAKPGAPHGDLQPIHPEPQPAVKNASFLDAEDQSEIEDELKVIRSQAGQPARRHDVSFTQEKTEPQVKQPRGDAEKKKALAMASAANDEALAMASAAKGRLQGALGWGKSKRSPEPPPEPGKEQVESKPSPEPVQDPEEPGKQPDEDREEPGKQQDKDPEEPGKQQDEDPEEPRGPSMQAWPEEPLIGRHDRPVSLPTPVPFHPKNTAPSSAIPGDRTGTGTFYHHGTPMTEAQRLELQARALLDSAPNAKDLHAELESNLAPLQISTRREVHRQIAMPPEVHKKVGQYSRSEYEREHARMVERYRTLKAEREVKGGQAIRDAQEEEKTDDTEDKPDTKPDAIEEKPDEEKPDATEPDTDAAPKQKKDSFLQVSISHHRDTSTAAGAAPASSRPQHGSSSFLALTPEPSAEQRVERRCMRRDLIPLYYLDRNGEAKDFLDPAALRPAYRRFALNIFRVGTMFLQVPSAQCQECVLPGRAAVDGTATF